MIKALKMIWIMFLAEVISPMIPDKTVYMRFTRRFRFIGKVETLKKQAIKKI